MIRLMVFDMAGTVVNEQNTVYKTVHTALVAAGYEVSLDAVLLHAAGKEKFNAIKTVMEALEADPVSDEMVQPIFADFENRLETAYNQLIPTPMPGAAHVFEQLRGRGIKVVLNTGYKRAVAESLCHKLGWEVGNQIDGLVTASDVPQSRPHPDMILAAMHMFGITDSLEVGKIGDSIIDIEEGRNAGCQVYAGITTGAHNMEQLSSAEPTHILSALDELLTIL